MFALNLYRALIPALLLPLVALGLPLTESGNFIVREIDLVSRGLRFPSDGGNRIYGGEEAKIGQFPHQISLQWPTEPDADSAFHICGGSIITDRFIVTAAVCYLSGFPSIDMYRVVAGGHKNGIAGIVGTVYNISRFIVHEKFYLNHTAGIQINDIALIETTATIQFNNLVAPIALHRSFFLDGVQAVASGWGKTNVSSSDIIKQLFLIDPATCFDTLKYSNEI